MDLLTTSLVTPAQLQKDCDEWLSKVLNHINQQLLAEQEEFNRIQALAGFSLRGE